MNRGENRNPALVELILVLLFFSLSALVLVQVFVKAHLTSEESRTQTLGLLKAQDVMEQWKEDPEHPEALFHVGDGWEEAPDAGDVRTFYMQCNEELESVSQEQSTYEMRVNLWTETLAAGSLYHIQTQVNSLRDGKTEVVLKTARYIPKW